LQAGDEFRLVSSCTRARRSTLGWHVDIHSVLGAAPDERDARTGSACSVMHGITSHLRRENIICVVVNTFRAAALWLRSRIAL
jgi:hypothetical protein